MAFNFNASFDMPRSSPYQSPIIKWPTGSKNDVRPTNPPRPKLSPAIRSKPPKIYRNSSSPLDGFFHDWDEQPARGILQITPLALTVFIFKHQGWFSPDRLMDDVDYELTDRRVSFKYDWEAAESELLFKKCGAVKKGKEGIVWFLDDVRDVHQLQLVIERVRGKNIKREL
ncbi:hypothetical protein PROFUN_00496 [Planoprotostelium fungivorum]|uniref:Uncharacterized protein n=1 Tax=Planoprotostelium fungivorum TaxID=1890364 RepID=A0A2P6N0Z8_9EUKA|nr:hypothetical protein PROFUN_00496 [Planoprotostelium fungivorum]